VLVRYSVSDEVDTPTALIEEASNAFDTLCEERHVMGSAKYGPVKFLTINSIEEAMAEVLDLANYARYTFIKLWLLNRQMQDIIPQENLGTNSFVPNSKDGT
jgi:hypothetical protein